MPAKDAKHLGGLSFALIRNIARGLALVVAVAMLWGMRVEAQANSSVTGIVTDASGAIVVGADVKLTDASTAYVRTAKTNSSGVYEFLQVPPGSNYTISFSREGFQTLTLEKIALSVGNKETRDARLQIGDTKTTIEVQANAGETLNTTDAAIGSVVDGARVQDLPSLFVNNAVLFLELAPGVGQGGDVTGTRSDQTNVTLDGLDVNDQRNGQAFISTVNTPLDSIQELRATVTGEDATFGNSAGAQLELVTKSGTNQFHGQAFDFNRVTALAANDFFNNLNDIPNPELIRNQFGGDVGGPIIKNKLYFFFSYNGLRAKQSEQINEVVPLDAFRNGQLNYINTSGNLVTTPLSGTNSLAQLDPQGIGADQDLLSFISQRPYPESNNSAVGDGINTGGYFFVAPVNARDNTFVGRVDYQATPNHRLFARGTWDRSNDDDFFNHIIQVFPNDPAPAASVLDHSRSWVFGDTWVISPNMTNELSFGETTSLLVFPLNYKPTSPNLLSFFFNGSVISSPFQNLDEQFPDVPVYQLRETLNWTRGKHTLQFGGVVKPTIFKSGNLTDTNLDSVGLGGDLLQLSDSNRPTDFGNAPNDPSNEWDQVYALLLGRIAATTSGYNYDLAGNPQPQGGVPIRDYHSTAYEFFAQDSWQVRSGLTLTYGLRWQFHNPLSEVNGYESVPNMSANQIFAIRTDEANQGISGPNAVPFVSYSLGGSKNHGPDYYRPSYTDFAPRIGLAYSPSFTGGFLGHLLGDRKTSIRTGFGIDYDNNLIGQGFELDETSFLFSNTIPINNGDLSSAPRFACTNPCNLANLNASFPVPPDPGTTPRPSFTPNLDSNGFPIGFFDGGFGAGPFFNFDPNYKSPYEMHFSLGFQRQLPGDWLVEATYVGKLGRRLTAMGDPAQTLNFKDATSGQTLYDAFGKLQAQLPNITSLSQVTSQPWFENQINAALVQTFGSGATCENVTGLNCSAVTVALAGNYVGIGDVSSAIVTLADFHDFSGEVQQGLLLPNVSLLAQNGAAGFIGNFSSSSYNGLILRASHKMSHNLTMELNYTYAHSIDNDSGVQNGLIGFSASEVCDLRNLRVCRGNSDFDATHTVAANFEYGLPVGRDQWLFRDSSKWVDEIFGGWKLSGIVIADSGFPFKVDTNSFAIDFTQTAPAVFTGSKADVARGIHTVASTGEGQAATIQYFSNLTNAEGAFSFPFGGGTGNRNVIRGPNFWNLDMALLKDFTMPWSDRQKLQFRAEGINVLNHVNFANPAANLEFNGNFGNITSDVNGPRNIQLALKYSF